MKKILSVVLLATLAVAAVVPSAEARRLGGGSSIGRQSSSPAMREAPRQTPREAPQEAARSTSAPAQAAAPAGVPQKPSFMNRWGGMIAGIGMGALLGSMLGGNLGGLGSALGGILNIVLIGGALYLAYRFFMSRRQGGAPAGMQFAGANGYAPPQVEPVMRERSYPTPSAPLAAPLASVDVPVPPGFEVEPFIRQAQSSFIRLQAANDDGDLADLRDTTTPEMFAEIAMQIRERGNVPQKTDVVTLDARLIEVVVDGDQMIASLRYSGLIREAAGAPALPFDEVWHLRRAVQPANGPWLIAGIQQMA